MVTRYLITFDKHIKKEVLDKLFCEGFPNSAWHTR